MEIRLHIGELWASPVRVTLRLQRTNYKRQGVLEQGEVFLMSEVDHQELDHGALITSNKASLSHPSELVRKVRVESERAKKHRDNNAISGPWWCAAREKK